MAEQRPTDPEAWTAAAAEWAKTAPLDQVERLLKSLRDQKGESSNPDLDAAIQTLEIAKEERERQAIADNAAHWTTPELLARVAQLGTELQHISSPEAERELQVLESVAAERRAQDAASDLARIAAEERVGRANAVEAIAEMERAVIGLQNSSVTRRAEEWGQEVQDWLDWLTYLDERGSEVHGPSREEAWQSLGQLAEERDRIMEEVRQEKLARLGDEMQRVQAEAVVAAKQAAALEAKAKVELADALRDAYRKGDTSDITDVIDRVKSLTGLAENVAGLAENVAEVAHFIADVQQLQSATLRQLAEAKEGLAKLIKGLNGLNKALDGMSLALTIMDREKLATEFEQGLQDLKDITGVVSAVTSLAKVPSSPLLNYVSSAIEQISRLGSVMVERGHEANRASIARGEPLWYPDAEPGGEAMRNFMKAVMHAETSAQVPKIGGPIAEYLVEHRKALGAGAEEPVPTTGLIRKELEVPGAHQWIFEHRDRVWAMFYGATEVPPR